MHSCRPFAPIREAVGVLYRGYSHVQLPSAGHGLGYWQSSVPASLQRWARFNRCSTLSENETKKGGGFCKSQLTTLESSTSSHLKAMHRLPS